MPLHRFDTVFGMGTQMAGGTVDTDGRITLVLSVSIPVGGAVDQRLILRTEHTVAELATMVSAFGKASATRS